VADALEKIRLDTHPDRIALEEIEIPAKKTDLTVEDVVLAWVPAAAPAVGSAGRMRW
jgi:hypothetical protein